jgi:hypothetical protein
MKTDPPLQHFGKNPFFKNSTITVDIKHSDDEGATVTSTPFEWLPGKVSTCHTSFSGCSNGRHGE